MSVLPHTFSTGELDSLKRKLQTAENQMLQRPNQQISTLTLSAAEIGTLLRMIDMTISNNQYTSNNKSPPGYYVCHKCNVSGHWIQHCPLNNNKQNNINDYNQSPPPNYTCHRCGIPGHWIRNCPTNSNRPFDNKQHLMTTNNYNVDDVKDDKLMNLGAGDTELRYNILSDDIKDNAFYDLKNEISWNRMKHREGFVPRLVSNQGIIYKSNHNIDFEPIYRHPATEQPVLIEFTPFVDKIRKICENLAGHTLNHALIQYYRNGNDYISDHSDKTIDVDQNSKIINFSVGATRLMILKKKNETKHDIKMNHIKNNQRINLLNNSLLILGLKTNKFMYHTIMRDNRQRFLKRNDELLFNGGRISITFRKINTFKSRTHPKNVLIGQGAKLKNKNCIINVAHDKKQIIFNKDNVNFKQLTNDEQEREFKQLIYAFGDENMKAASFDWQKTYGQGFSVVF